MAIFPTERANAATSRKYEELEILYTTVSNFISSGLENYENNPRPSNLFGTIMILKAACMNNSSYIDMSLTSFMKVLHSIAKEHLQPSTPEASPSTYL